MKLPRVYPIVDTGSLQRRGLGVLQFTEALLDAGAALLQFRHKSAWTRDAADLLAVVAERCRRYGCGLVVNDRADLAAVFDAGVHVGQEDLAPEMARRVVGEGRMVGFSTHNAQQLLSPESGAADYLAFGPVFGTTTKENPDPTVGLEELKRLRPQVDKPLVAIGGITRDTARAVWDAGADTIAVIGDLLPDGYAMSDVRARMKEWLELSK